MNWYDPEEMGGALGEFTRATEGRTDYSNGVHIASAALFAFSAAVSSRYRLTPAATGLGLNILLTGHSGSGKTSALNSAADAARSLFKVDVVHGGFADALAVSKRGGDAAGVIDESAAYTLLVSARDGKPVAKQVCRQIGESGLWSMAWEAILNEQTGRIDRDCADGLIILLGERLTRGLKRTSTQITDIPAAHPNLVAFGEAIKAPHWMAIEAIDGSNKSRLAAIRAVSRAPGAPVITNDDLRWADAVLEDSDEARSRFVKPPRKAAAQADADTPTRDDEILRLLSALSSVEEEVARIKTELLELQRQ